MKATVTFLVGFLFAVSTYGQGQVNFANTSSTLLTTNTCAGGIFPFYRVGRTGLGFTVGLYIAPFAATDDYQFALVATTPSQGGIAPGRFDGGSVTIPGSPAGTLISFQIRVWHTSSGATYEQAQNFTTFYGKSARGFVILGAGGLAEPLNPRLMGTNYGQVPGFTLYYAGGPYYGPQNQIYDEFSCGFPPAMTNVAMQITGAGSGGHTVSWNNNVTAYPATFLLEWTPSLPAPQWNAVTDNVLNLNNCLSYSSANSSARFYRLRRL